MTRKTATRSIEVGEADFDTEVLKSKLPVLAAFWSPWSHPCQIIEATLEQVAAACGAKAKVVKVNADSNPALSFLFEVQAVPTLLYFIDGTVHGRVVGTASQEAILAKLEAVLAEGPRAALPSAARKAGGPP